MRSFRLSDLDLGLAEVLQTDRQHRRHAELLGSEQTRVAGDLVDGAGETSPSYAAQTVGPFHVLKMFST